MKIATHKYAMFIRRIINAMVGVYPEHQRQEMKKQIARNLEAGNSAGLRLIVDDLERGKEAGYSEGQMTNIIIKSIKIERGAITECCPVASSQCMFLEYDQTNGAPPYNLKCLNIQNTGTDPDNNLFVEFCPLMGKYHDSR